MWRHINVGDVVVITFSAFVVIWGANRLLRNLGMDVYEA